MKKNIIALFTTIAIAVSCLQLNSISVLASNQTLSNNGLNFVKKQEGFSSKQYWDYNQWSIGYGSKTYDGEYPNGITKEEATQLLKKQIVKYEGYVNTFLTKNSITLNQNQFDALVSFTYNLGNVWASSQYPTFQLKTYLIDGVEKHTEQEIRTAFGNWNKAGGQVNQGLVNRRKAEADLFLSGFDPDPIPQDELTKDVTYKTPISCVACKKMNVYYSSGSQDSGHYISAGDNCTIKSIYTNGLCAVAYPTSNGTRDAYAKFKDFTPNSVTPYSYIAPKAYPTYTHSDKKTKYGSLSVNDSCTVVGKTGNLLQLIYPIKNGYKLGWVDTNDLQDIVKPEPEPDPTSVTIPLAVAKGFFQNKEIVAMAPNKIEFSNTQYISKDDICRIKDVNNTSGKCTVIYPSGSDDVFNASKTVTKTINITDMVTKYSDDYAVYKLTALKDYKVYPTSSKTDDKGRNWQLDKGDEYYTIAKSGGMTEVLYYCNRGAHKGYWKLGWIEIDYYYLDLNGYLDGTDNGKLTGYGYTDIVVNGETSSKVQDYYKEVPYGSTYQIKNPTALIGHTYNGVQSGSLTGTVTQKTSVRLKFSTNPPTLCDIYISSNPYKTEYLEGEWLDTNGLVVTARYDNASTQNVTSSCEITGYDSMPGVKTIYARYGGCETAFTVDVRSKSPTNLEIASLPSKTVYKTGEDIDLTGLSVRVTYDNGTSAFVDNYDVYINDESVLSTGLAIVEISYMYNGISQYATFNISINGKIEELVLGDVNGDGEIDIADALLVMKYDAGLTIIDEAFQQAADVNNDDEIDIADAILIMKYDAGLIERFN